MIIVWGTGHAVPQPG